MKTMAQFDELVEFFESISGCGQTYHEAHRICKTVEDCNDKEGVFVEVGVHEGRTAQIIKKYANPNKEIMLFDTFEGLVYCNARLDGWYLVDGMISSEYESVRKIFENDKNVKLYKGVFPDSGREVLQGKKISFVHLDVDTYQSTYDSLVFLYDKIEPGGVIIIHDYTNNPHTPGVKKAVDLFFKGKQDFLFIPENDDSRMNTQIIITKK